MVAMSALTIAMVMLFSTFLSGQMLSTTNKHRHRALMDAQALMEQMGVMPLNTIAATFPHDTPIPEFDDLHVPNQEVRVRYEGGNPNARPLMYEVLSTWTTVGGQPAQLLLRGVRAR
jgi:hypothetical protein